jgi:2,4-dienoyl-CoA reductase-like NADH-dependent reductase (Old Yellow Enzyme family)
MVDNSKLFEKYKLNNNVEVPGRLAIAPMVFLEQMILDK